MENFYHNLMLDIANCFVTNKNEVNTINNIRNIASLIRIHNKNYAEAGEVSFPCDQNLWEIYFPAANGYHLNQEAFELFDKENIPTRFLDKSLQWTLPVSRLNVHKERCHLYLKRSCIVGKLIHQVLNDVNFGCLKKRDNLKVYIKPLQSSDLSNEDLAFHRVRLLRQTLQKVLNCSRYTVEKEEETATVVIDVVNMSSYVEPKEKLKESEITIRCEPITYPIINGVACHLNTEQYLERRSDYIRKMALFRSRPVVLNDVSFDALINHLGSADVTVSLLEVKHTSPVQITAVGLGGTRRASFLLYNTARLEAILKAFEERIKCQEYEKQPELRDIDWGVLNEEEEWQLVFTYIAGFPDLIDRCVENLERGIFSVHLIIHFLNGLVSLFSKYYIRIRILTEKRDNLMHFVYARIYLLRAVREILNKTLDFLDIKPVESM